MKKTIIIIITFLVFLCGCNKINNISKQEKEEALFGVVETTSNKYKSYVNWYDKDLNLLRKDKERYAMLGSNFYRPTYHDEEILLIPEGLGNKKDTKKVIGINKQSLNIEEYPFDNIALNSLTASGDYIYTVNTLNRNTHLTSYDKKNKVSEEIILKDEYLCGITSAYEKIYAFASNLNEINPKFMLYIYSEKLELENKIDVTEYGTGQNKFLLDGEYLYTNIGYTKGELPGRTILKISTKTFEIEEIELSEQHPNDIFKYKDKLIITNYNLVTGQGTKVTLLDINNHNIEVKDLEEELDITEIYDNRLIAVNNKVIKIFDMDSNFSVINETNIEKDDDMYTSAILLLK